jgi:tripartite-type tricarboxylate transporter receptor subunit TctC
MGANEVTCYEENRRAVAQRLEGSMNPCVQAGLRQCGPIIAALALLAESPVYSADWPARPIHIVAPFGPAGAADKFARVLADYLPAEIKQAVVVENRGGGGGIVGSAQVARAEPDGYTLLISSLASQAIAPVLSSNPGFDSLRDFTHIAYLGGPPIGWVVTPGSDLRSVDDVIAKSRRGELPGYASSGIGTLGHLVAEVAIAQAGVHLNHIPYNTAALPDILAGHVPLASYAWSSVIGQVQAGTLRAIAVSTATRQPDFPDVPTFREQGFDIVASTWFALSGPANMPREIVARLNRDVYRIMERPEVRLRFAQDAIEFKSMTPDELTKLFESEIARWGVVVRDSGLKRS